MKPWSQDWLIAAGAYPSFCSMKRLEVQCISTSPGRDASPSQVTSQQFVRFPQQFASTHLYTWVERGTVRVKCLVQEHNTMSPGQNKYFFKKIQMVCYLSYATSCQHFGCNTTNSTNTHNHHCVVTNSLVRKFKFEKRIKYCFLNKQHLDIKHHVLRQSLCSSLVVTQAGTVFVW